MSIFAGTCLFIIQIGMVIALWYVWSTMCKIAVIYNSNFRQLAAAVTLLGKQSDVSLDVRNARDIKPGELN
jgi:hypothetical protein